MFFDRQRPHAFREHPVPPSQANALAERQCRLSEARAARAPGCEDWAVHLAHDRTRVMVVEAWKGEAEYRRDPDSGVPGAALYAWAGTGGVEPTPVEPGAAGVIVIDVFPVWQPLVRR